ncbi:MAG: C40 family peptidase [Candidatus Cohnella colombiensis]|uniref:C40 family peptidase n=1 Tax=Candidatus Cohnella colombiensis TaxID=3121368 RepID=A0AA95F040_9BACL|nr:MAG: C40 family peptidase [Cohnella sp.]
MNNNHRFSKKFLSIALSATIGLSAIAAGQAQPVAAATVTTSKATKIINLGDNYLGVKYKFGASTNITSAFDCSSFTKYIFGKYGVKLPRVSSAQAKVGKYVSKSNLKKGDLVFFSTARTGKKIGHVAVYAGNNKILHTYGKPGVTFSNLNSSHWKSHYVTARRVL